MAAPEDLTEVAKSKLPGEITDIKRAVLVPGSRLIVRCKGHLSAQAADDIREIVRRRLALPDDILILVCEDSIDFQVVEDETE